MAATFAEEICEVTEVMTEFEEMVYFNVTGLEACAEYHVTVTPVTPSGDEGDVAAESEDANTGILSESMSARGLNQC
jgi:hypothetical protein